MSCAHCGKNNVNRACGLCAKEVYCNQKCANLHFTKHMKVCGKNDRQEDKDVDDVARKKVGNARARARDVGIVFEGTEPGAYNSITDVAGVEVGYTTIIEGDDVRTGVTIIHPRGKKNHNDAVFGSLAVINGNGDVTGAQWLQEFGMIAHPIGLTTSCRVGIVRDAILDWQYANGYEQLWGSPVVMETWDGQLNNDRLRSINYEHVYSACENAKRGAIAEGNVGGGTGSISFEFKAGSGTASRTGLGPAENWTVGVFVQSNFGARNDLKITGIPIMDGDIDSPYQTKNEDRGSISVVIATDAPLSQNQLHIMAKHAVLGIARTGGLCAVVSGEFVIAFSTANVGLEERQNTAGGTATPNVAAQTIHNEILDSLTSAVVYATEEAIINTLMAADTMTGQKERTAHKLPVKLIADSFKQHSPPKIKTGKY